MTPTQLAEESFEKALIHLHRLDNEHLSFALQNMVQGMQNMARGSRATYQLVSDVQRELFQLERRVRDPRL